MERQPTDPNTAAIEAQIAMQNVVATGAGDTELNELTDIQRRIESGITSPDDALIEISGVNERRQDYH